SVVMSVMRVSRRIEALFPVKYQEIHPEGIKRSNEHTDQCGKVGKAAAPDSGGAGSLDDVLLGIEAREKRRPYQSERTNQEGDPGNGHVLAQPTHVADILVVMHADDD